MRTVKIKKNELQQVIKTNRDSHRAAFEKAIEEYRKAVITYLDERIDEVKSGKIISHMISLPQPTDHTPDYDQVLEMLDMSVDTDIELTNAEFAQYVRDDWGWKEQFRGTSSTLSAYNIDKGNI